MNLQEELKKIAAQYEQPPGSALSDAFPIGLPVRDKDGRAGVVVGYREGKVLVRETGVPSTETPPPVALAPEYIAPVHPRPSRYVMLASIEEAIVNAARRGDGTCVLALAQARALL